MVAAVVVVVVTAVVVAVVVVATTTDPDPVTEPTPGPDPAPAPAADILSGGVRVALVDRGLRTVVTGGLETNAGALLLLIVIVGVAAAAVDAVAVAGDMIQSSAPSESAGTRAVRGDDDDPPGVGDSALIASPSLVAVPLGDAIDNITGTATLSRSTTTSAALGTAAAVVAAAAGVPTATTDTAPVGGGCFDDDGTGADAGAVYTLIVGEGGLRSLLSGTQP